MNVILNIQQHNMYSPSCFRGVESPSVQAYKTFSDGVIKIVEKRRELYVGKFYGLFSGLARTFYKENGIKNFTKLAKSLMEFLVSHNYDNEAGIICSILIRFNKKTKDYKNVKDLALRGMAIARRSNDIVHIAARANDINFVLRQNEPGSDKHVKYMKVLNDSLEELCRNYNEDVIRNCSTNSRELAPLENYECSLFYAKLDIATYCLLKDPKYAKSEFEQAKEIYKRIRSNYTPEMAEKMDKKIELLEQKYKLCCL